jgi:predicted glycoside hydrolase/deacetylase ChbG (UPF0249 family)
MSQTAHRLVLCADDFALNASVSQGIAQLAAAGRLSATSVMSLSPRWVQDQALLKRLPQAIDVGLHLDWTSDFARAAGHGLSLGQAIRRAVLGGFDQAQAQWVIHRQLDLFEAHWQAPPDFVDGHQHVQQFDGIRQALVAVLKQRYGQARKRPYLRIARVDSLGLKERIISWMGADRLAHSARQAGMAHSEALAGVYDFRGSEQRFAGLMQSWLQQLAPRTIVMCHPACSAEPDDEIGQARAQEWAYLGSEGFAQALRSSGVALVRGAELLGARN